MRTFLALLLALGLTCPSAHAARRTKITIGFNPSQKNSQIESNGKRLSDYLKKKTGLAVNTFVAKDYEGLVDALLSGKVDFAFLPPFSFVKAESAGKARLLLKAVRHGQAVSYSAIFVRADRGIEKIEDLKGKRMGWVDLSSASGYVMPRADLVRKFKLTPEAFFSKETFFGAHDTLVRAVFDGEVDAGASWSNDSEAKDASWHLFLRKPSDQQLIKVIHVTDAIPVDAFTTTQALWSTERPMVESVAKTLQRMGEGLEGQQILRDLYNIDKMVPATAKDYQSVRDAAKALRSPTQ